MIHWRNNKADILFQFQIVFVHQARESRKAVLLIVLNLNFFRKILMLVMSNIGSNNLSLESWNSTFVELDDAPGSRNEEQARLVQKDGDLNLRHQQLVWGNPLHTENAIALKWVSVLQLIIMVFFGSWMAFAVAYYMMENSHGNIEGPSLKDELVR